MTMFPKSVYLSKDKMFLMDDEDRPILARKKEKGILFYQPIGIESEAFEKICRETSPLRVCTSWNDAHECRIWDEVEVCTRWDLVSKGYSNIS